MSEGRMRGTRLVGVSDKTHQVLRNIEKVNRGRWPVLILGETGTGKEVAARSIHDQAGIGPFVTIDCSSLVGALMESELFGHARGAFTGAIGVKLGLIEAANGGTAFFDEIGELPLDVQAKLLRVLQEKEFRPVGSLATKRSDFRIIAATNRDLSKEVDKGTFRRDLYYRLNVVTLRLSPLRERRDDIPPLVDHFLGLYGKGHTLTEEALDFLMQYDWPGNVRELENCIQQMVAISTGPMMHVNELPSALMNQFYASRRGLAMAAGASSSWGEPLHHASEPLRAIATGAAASAAFGDSSGGMAVLELPRIGPMSTSTTNSAHGHKMAVVPLELVEKQAILSAIEHTGGDRGQAASLLGIGRTTLYRKLKEYGFAV